VRTKGVEGEVVRLRARQQGDVGPEAGHGLVAVDRPAGLAPRLIMPFFSSTATTRGSSGVMHSLSACTSHHKKPQGRGPSLSITVQVWGPPFLQGLTALASAGPCPVHREGAVQKVFRVVVHITKG